MDGYRQRHQFHSPGIEAHFQKALKTLDAHPIRPSRRRIAAPWGRAKQADSIICFYGDEDTMNTTMATSQYGVRPASLPADMQPRNLHEVRTHINVCMRGLEEDVKRFERFKWFKRNLYKALIYFRGRVRAEALLDFIDDYLIKILEDEQCFIPPPRRLATELIHYGEQYGR